MSETEDEDPTRWNRAGLTRLRYVNANAATLLETLRKKLHDAFPEYRQELGEREPLKDKIAQNETAERDRLLEQYNQRTDEWGWEIARSLARACHVLTEHVDAYANEGYLRTATQWESVRRLVAMLDHHPAPPASASTPLIIHAKEGGPQLLSAGFQVKHTPPEGGMPMIFETLEDIEIDAALNRIRPLGYERNPDPLDHGKLRLPGRIRYLKAGQPLVLEEERSGRLVACKIERTSVAADSTTIYLKPRSLDGLCKGYTLIHAGPAEELEVIGPALGSQTQVEKKLRLTSVTDLSQDDVIYVSDGTNHYYRVVETVAGKQLVLKKELGELMTARAGAARPGAVPIVNFQAESVADEGASRIASCQLAGDWSGLYLQRVAVVGGVQEISELKVTSAEYHPVTGCSRPESDAGKEGYTWLSLSGGEVPAESPQGILIPPQSGAEWRVDTAIETGDDKLLPSLTTGAPAKTVAGDIAVVQTGTRTTWARLASVLVNGDGRNAVVTPEGAWEETGDGPYYLSETTLFSHFRQSGLRVAEWNLNNKNFTDLKDPANIRLETLPKGLTRDRRVLVRLADESDYAMPASITEVGVLDPDTKKAQDRVPYIKLNKPLPDQAKIGNLIIAANLVTAGHGETRGPKVFSSGTESLPGGGGSLLFDQRAVSFVSDPFQASGVRADIQVTIDGRTWQQVSTLNESGPLDPHYTVRMTEDGYLRLEFGDGRLGRRLPVGSNNVRIASRVGTGLVGNGLAPGSLETPVRPHPFVESVRQPLPTEGGNDMESIDSLRHHAPASLLTLDRAVSLSDFRNIATANSKVWQAEAFPIDKVQGRRQLVDVVVVPAGGFGLTDDLVRELARYLSARSLPSVEVRVSGFEGKKFRPIVKVWVKTAEHDTQLVEDRILEALIESFSLQNRRLGQAVHRSELYRIVESIEGVESSSCEITPWGEDEMLFDPTIDCRSPDRLVQSISVAPWQVAYIPNDPGDRQKLAKCILAEDYQL